MSKKHNGLSHTTFTLALGALLAGLGAYATAATQPADHTGTGTICYDQLPGQAHHTLDLISHHGPYPYDKDGTVFSNREHELPEHDRGYYHEFTVTTPGAHTRGTRRIVTGGKIADKVEDYYTSDHYESFDRVVYTC